MNLIRFVILITSFSIKICLGTANQDLIQNGRAQYQLLKEKGNLPQYGACWKQGVEYLDHRCQYLTEDIQSELALHFTNCFLKMSGHETYNCDSDKKINLRAICINNMSDRAFNVYTEFYTHIQNICGFLQGHIWHEMIAENTMAVGIKLRETAKNQEGLLQAQKESLILQEKMLQHGRVLENVLEDLFHSFRTHQDVLNVLSQTVSNLQNWIVGEMSWFDSVIFYIASIILIFIFTSSQRTNAARALIFVLLVINFLIERLICALYLFFSHDDTSSMHSTVNSYIWFVRYSFIIFTVVLLSYFVVTQGDPFRKQYELLRSIQEQNCTILSMLKNSESYSDKAYLNNVNDVLKSFDKIKRCSKMEKDSSNQMQQECFSSLNNSVQDSNLVETDTKNKSSIDKNVKNKKSVLNSTIQLIIEKQNKSANYNLRSSSRSSSVEHQIV